DPRQHHRHRPLVRRLRRQPGRDPHGRVPARAPGLMTTTALTRRNGRAAIVAVAAILLPATFFVVHQPGGPRKGTAHFPRAASVHKGTDVRVLGVNVGRVTAVIPEGNSVRVDMEYDADVDIPANAKAVVITPTLVADRFVQLTPVYTSGPRMKDGADIP